MHSKVSSNIIIDDIIHLYTLIEQFIPIDCDIMINHGVFIDNIIFSAQKSTQILLSLFSVFLKIGYFAMFISSMIFIMDIFESRRGDFLI